MSIRDKGCRHGSQSYGSSQINIPRDVRSRYVLGVFPRVRGHVKPEISAETSRIFGCCSKLPARHRGPDACYQSAEEGRQTALYLSLHNRSSLHQDISSSLPPTISLPLVTLPHIITSPLALSLLSDLLPRLSHSNMNIRKKTVAALYRLALVYPDSLKFAWPKIKDVLLDEEQDSSVTAAVVNVVCELGWRRPREFLSLAPRLFELLIDGGNNWMAIKIIKLVRPAIM